MGPRVYAGRGTDVDGGHRPAAGSRGPIGAFLVGAADAGDETAVPWCGQGQAPNRRMGGGRAGPVRSGTVVQLRGTGPVDGWPAAFLVQRPDAGGTGRPGGENDAEHDGPAASGGYVPSRVQARSRSHVRAVGRQQRVGRDPRPEVGPGGDLEPRSRRVRRAQWVRVRQHRHGGRG